MEFVDGPIVAPLMETHYLTKMLWSLLSADKNIAAALSHCSRSGK